MSALRARSAVQVLRNHPDVYFLLLGTEHSSEWPTMRLMNNVIDKVALLLLPYPCLSTASIPEGHSYAM